MMRICKDIDIVKKSLLEDKLNLVIVDDILYDVVDIIEDNDLDRELISVRICHGYFSKGKVYMKNSRGWVVLKDKDASYLQEEIVSDIRLITDKTKYISLNLEKELSYKLEYIKVEMRNVICGIGNPYWEDESIECIELIGGDVKC